jgi:hypothetical protein
MHIIPSGNPWQKGMFLKRCNDYFWAILALFLAKMAILFKSYMLYVISYFLIKATTQHPGPFRPHDLLAIKRRGCQNVMITFVYKLMYFESK